VIKIPLFNLTRQHKNIKNKIIKNWSEIIDTNSFTSGTHTQQFEDEFSKLCATKYSLGVHSGTDAIIIALKAAGLKKNDEIITTPCTFSASSDCIIHVGAKPVFADVQKNTGNIDPEDIIKRITPKTRAILLVHLYGVPCDMDEILKIAKKYKLLIIEDASHAHGSLYNSKPVGSFGLAGCFSLYPSKTLGSLGNAGVITSNNESFIKKARMYANHGIKSNETKYTHHVHGFNKLIDNVQSAALLIKMSSMKKIIKEKIKIADQYNQALEKAGYNKMFWPENTYPSLYIFAFQVKNRTKVAKHFEKNGVSTGIYYPTPLHLQPSMKKLGYKKGDFPNAELFFKQTLSIPLFTGLNKNEVDKILKTIQNLDVLEN
jgi:dTDP-4-amino-4,6-dideoxygalactose transaminase